MDGACLGSDGKDVIMFGDLPSKYNAMTCTYWNGSNAWGYDKLVEADTKFNTTDKHWNAVTDSSCTSAMDMRAIATHEFGHWMGLADLYGNTDGNQTMYGYSDVCESRFYTLGNGDYDGLERLYNP